MALPGKHVQVADRVRETTTSTGTGDLALDGAMDGFKSFAVGTVLGGDYFCYEVHAVDAGGVPTGEWETGIGAVGGTTPNWTLRRLYCLKNSAGTSGPSGFLNFAAGTKHVSLSIVAANLDDRKIDAVPIIYVRSDGNDANTGFANTAGGAVATLAAAVVRATAFREATIEIGAGTFAGAGVYDHDIDLYIVGAGAGVTVIDEFSVGGRNVIANLSGLTVSALRVEGASCFIWGELLDFAANAGGPHIAANDGGRIDLGEYTISGSADSHIAAGVRGRATLEGAITLAADVTFAGGFACATGPQAIIDTPYGAPVIDTATYTVTGPRYVAERNSVIDTQGSGATYFPGTVAGTTDSGGQYL